MQLSGVKMNKENNKFSKSWFYQWFINNRMTVILLNIFLILLIIFLFTKVRYVFAPIGQILGVIMPTVIVSIVLFYLLEPVVDLFEQKFHVNRILIIAVVFIVIFGLLVWGIVSFIPFLQSQLEGLLKSWPGYWDSFQTFIAKYVGDDKFNNSNLQKELEQFTKFWGKKLAKQANSLIPQTFNNLGSAMSIVTNIVMVLVTAPFAVFFMLKDREQFFSSFLKYVPSKFRKSTGEVITEMSDSLSSYIRGQITVAFWVGVMFFVGYLVIGQKYALPLAIMAGVFNLIPYVGSALALIPSLIIALFTPGLFIKVVIVFILEQTLETRVVSPLVVGNKMQMHPLTTIVVLLGSASLFGVMGMILGIPVYAIFKIIISKIFAWFKINSGLYTDEEVIEESIENEEKN